MRVETGPVKDVARALLFCCALGLLGAGTVLANNGSLATNGKPPAAQQASGTPIPQKEVAPFFVIGIATRTTNARESGPNGVIPQQWQKFFQEGVLDKIPEKIGPNIYAVYTDYASDHNGEYTCVIGAMVKQGTAPPAGMVAETIAGGRYAVVASEKGPLPQVIPAAWQRILQLESDGKLHRAYKSDFEVYDQRSQNPADAQVDIYLGLK
jgi:predicted transcriptional regulator YdeE